MSGRMGRTPVPPEKIRSDQFGVRLTPREGRLIRRLCSLKQTPIGAFARRILMPEVRRQLRFLSYQ